MPQYGLMAQQELHCAPEKEGGRIFPIATRGSVVVRVVSGRIGDGWMKQQRRKEALTRATSLGAQQHAPIRAFLKEYYGPILLGLMPDSTEKMIFKELLKQKRPVRGARLQEVTKRGKGTVSEAAERLRENHLEKFFAVCEPFQSKHVIITLPCLLGGTHPGYQFVLQNTETDEHLGGAATRDFFAHVRDYEIEITLRKKWAEETHHELSRMLDERDDYQTMSMEIGTLEKRVEPRHCDERSGFRQTTCGQIRIWRPFDPQGLSDPTGVYILSSETGTGKSTFLETLRQSMLADDKRLPIFLHASDIQRRRYKGLNGLLRNLAKELETELDEEALVEFLRGHISDKIVLLVDEVDQSPAVGKGYEQFLTKLVYMCVKNSVDVIIASRPTAVVTQESNPDVFLLRLKPFDVAMQRSYFGNLHAKARELCRHDADMIAVPMLAHMVRSLIKEGREGTIANRTSLYQEFVDYILHRCDLEGLEISETECENAREFLQRIAFKALRKGAPYIQRIPFSLCRPLIPYRGLSLDVLLKLGLVTEIVDRSKGTTRYLCFTHQSFQEYLAAEWVNEKKERIEVVLREYWNPNWRNVIKFLAGLAGETVIAKIYSSPEYDNAIHSRLFLAAECVAETKTDTGLQRKLLDDIWAGPLKSVVVSCAESPLQGRYQIDGGCSCHDYEPFAHDGLKALISLGTPESMELAWLFTAHLVTQGYPYGCLCDCRLMEPLFTADRLESMYSYVNRVRAGMNRSSDYSPSLAAGRIDAALNVLNVWARILPPEFIDSVFEQMLFTVSISFQRPALSILEVIAGRLNREQIEETIRVGTSASVNHGVEILKAISCSLGPEDLKKLMNLLWTSNGARRLHLLGALAQIGDVLHDEKDELLECFACLREKDKSLLAIRIAPLMETASEKRIQNVMRDLNHPKLRVRMNVMRVISEIGHRLPLDDFDRILAFLDDGWLREYAIRIVARVPTRLSSSQINRILNFLKDRRCSARRAALWSVKHLHPYVREEHIDAILRDLRSEYWHDAICACPLVAMKMTTIQKWRLVEECVRLSKSPLFAGMLRPIFRAVGQSLEPGHIDYVAERIRATITDPIGMPFVLFDLLPVDFLDSNHIELLSTCLDHRYGQFKAAAYRKLHQVHEAGRLG